VIDPRVHPKDRTTPQEWGILNLADSWINFDDRVRESKGKDEAAIVNASVCLMALQLAVREWRKARVYDPEAYSRSEGK
jgi:hypothetical protein